MHVILFLTVFIDTIIISGSNTCFRLDSNIDIFISNSGGYKHMLDSTWGSAVMLQCWLVISGKKEVQLTRWSLTWRNRASVAHPVLQQLIPDLPAEHTRVLSLVLLDALLHVGCCHLLQVWKGVTAGNRDKRRGGGEEETEGSLNWEELFLEERKTDHVKLDI